jgi:hypothetical protein
MLAPMASRATWAKRVAEWRQSGLTSEQFCAGRRFTPGGLRSAACAVDREEGKTRSVRVARVVRTSVPVSRASSKALTPTAAASEVELLVELGGARIAVRRGCDAATLTTVLKVLAHVGGGQ